ncbi:MAG: hypothetical protein AAF717_15360 [Bacteroidota bacterium]
MNKIGIVFGLLFLQACGQKPYHGALEFSGKFPSRLSEVSGIDRAEDGSLWVLEDNGNKDKLYQISAEAKVIKEFKIDNAKNGDWEDLTISKAGTFFIGDFGNNTNSRKDLVVYKILPKEFKKKEPKAKKLRFNYPEQKKFPPKSKDLLYDAEGFFHWEGHLYIFTKNRSRPYTGKTLIYRISDTKEKQQAELLGSLVLCEDQHNCSVTGADISENGKTVVLIGYGKLFLLSDFSFPHISEATIRTIDLEYETQIESVCFINDSTLLIADEQSKTKGRNLYKYLLK